MSRADLTAIRGERKNKVLQISLAAARVNAGLTQKYVAKELRVSNKTLANWENGKTKPSFSTLQTLARLYGISADNLKY